MLTFDKIPMDSFHRDPAEGHYLLRIEGRDRRFVNRDSGLQDAVYQWLRANMTFHDWDFKIVDDSADEHDHFVFGLYMYGYPNVVAFQMRWG